MSDTLTLLQLTADLHLASRHPQRWPSTWKTLCRWFDCPEILGDGELSATGSAAVAEIAALAERAGCCAQAAAGRCGFGDHLDEYKRQCCLLLIAHARLALGAAAAAMSAKTSMAALDLLPVALFECAADGRLIYANHAARAELEQRRCLHLDAGRLCASHARQKEALARALRDIAAAPVGRGVVLMTLADGREADLGLRRIEAVDDQARVLVSLVTHAAPPSSAQIARLAAKRAWSPRQGQLAGLLLAGKKLNAAASIMGIARRTAEDHLQALFRATGTRRQQDLIARLTRDMMT